MHPSVCIVDVPTRPDDLPQELDLDRHMVASRVKNVLGRLINEVILRPGAEQHVKAAIDKHLRRLQATGTISNFKVDEASCVSGQQQTFDEVNLPLGAAPGDPYMEVDPTTGAPVYGGLVIFSDGEGRGLVFRGHEGVKGTGPAAVKVRVSVQVPHSVDYVVITAEYKRPDRLPTLRA